MNIQTKTVKEKHRENGGKSRMIKYAIPIIATLPDGRKVGFKSLSEAERTLGIDSTYLSKALRRDNPEFGGWLWTRSNGETITESLTEEMISTFQNPVRGKKKATPISRYENPIEVVPKKK